MSLGSSTALGWSSFFLRSAAHPIASPALLGQITGKFVAEVKSFIGIAQEKAKAFSARRLPGKRALFEFTRTKSVIPNYYYFYLDDAEWGECFIKVCSYAPWGLKVYLNGHEWLKRQLAKQGIGFEALDNGFLSCVRPERLQELADSLGAAQVQSFLGKWLERLPMPLEQKDRRAGYDY
jgi:hypothetical protein